MEKQVKRIANDEIIKSQLKAINPELKDGIFIFNSPLPIFIFAKKIKKPVNEIISYFFKQGKIFNINHILDEDDIAEVCIAFGYDFQKEEENLINAQNFMNQIVVNDEAKSLQTRPPIITIMGHIDHGKTTLIDKIRNSNITDKEVGGITQHIGAYQINYDNHKITFLDTPGHEAFTNMRAYGSKLTDIVVLVIAADDGVMPQTKEAIDHTLATNTPIIVFINKMDKPRANHKKVINSLVQSGILVEEIGGTVQCVKGSAIKKIGIKDLFNAINVQAELLELKANPNRMPIGVVVESKIKKGKGVVVTLIVTNGSLFPGDFLVVGSNYGRVRTMENTKQEIIKIALPGTPVMVTGINNIPNAGDKFFGFDDEKFARKLANKKALLDKEDELKEKPFFKKEGSKKILNLIIKTDVQGISEAAKYSLSNLNNEEVTVNIVRNTTGVITKSDITLANASNAIIFGFNVPLDLTTRNEAKNQGVKIKNYSIIYKMIEDVNDIIKNMKAPKYQEKITGKATIQKIIYFSKVGNIAGCRMNEGKIIQNSNIRLIRNNEIIHNGQIDSLKREKDAVQKVEMGNEFGTHIKDFNKIQEGDIIEAYRLEKIQE